MSVHRSSYAFFDGPGEAKATAARRESSAERCVPRADLWRAIDAARRFYNSSLGRLDSVRFLKYQEELEHALGKLPPK